MKQFDEWRRTSTIHPKQAFTCERAMEEAFKAGHKQGFDEGFKAGGSQTVIDILREASKNNG